MQTSGGERAGKSGWYWLHFYFFFVFVFLPILETIKYVLFCLLSFNHYRVACCGGWLGTFASSSPTITGSTPTVTRITKEEVRYNGSRLAGIFSQLLARLNYDEEDMMAKMGGCRLYRWVFISQASSLTSKTSFSVAILCVAKGGRGRGLGARLARFFFLF